MSKANIDVTAMTSLAEARAFAPKWAELAEAAGAKNPFVHPDWMMPWAERSVRSAEQIWLLAAQQDGHLVGVAPFYRRSWGSGLAHSMQPWGTGRNGDLIELPQFLLDQGQPRNVARALVGRLCAEAKLWDWAFVPLEDSLWFEPDWLPGAGSIIVLTRTVRASVVRKIDTSSPPGNLRESVRRVRNRLDREYPGRWLISRSTSRSDILDAFPDLVSLHTAGSEAHSNILKHESDSSLLLAVLAALADRGGACIYRLLIDGHAMAALLVLRTAECSYLLLSGMSEPWDYSPVTLLQSCAIDDAIKLDHRQVNLSTRPDTEKMRWSEHVSVHPEFVLVPNRPLSLATFGTYLLGSAFAGVRRERSQHGLLSSRVRFSGRSTLDSHDKR